MSEPDRIPHDLDLCECGDYRRDHKGGTGACNLNGLGHGMTGYRCNRFRFSLPATAEDIERIRKIEERLSGEV